jgi:hypothetical protein
MTVCSFGLSCGTKYPVKSDYESYSEPSYGPKYEQYGALLPENPTPVTKIGKGALTASFDIQKFPSKVEELIDLGKHRYAYKVGYMTGYM